MIYFGAIILSACLYRWGGASREELPLANSQIRDIGCPVIVFGYFMALGVTWYIALVAAFAILGLIRTYWDFITGEDNLWLHGAGIGICMTPLCWDGVSWVAVVAYTAILAVTMGALNTFCTRVTVPFAVWIEELFRGAVIIAAIPVLYFIK
jgi:hypothetical protein